MDTNFEDLRSWKNPKARVKIMKGHFVTTHSHVNTYIDLSTMKSRCNNARETAKVMAEPYLASTEIDTIVCPGPEPSPSTQEKIFPLSHRRQTGPAR